MKKTYRKPMLVVERFALSQTIAISCGKNVGVGKPNFESKEKCGWLIEGYEIFADMSVCDNPSEFFEGLICYNAPKGGLNIFAS